MKWKEKYDNAYRDLQEVEVQLESKRKRATENNEETAILEQKLQKVNVLLGLTEVKGKGLIITVDDNKTMMSQALDPNRLVVHDGDLIEIVNLLKNVGAEAISINDQRIINNTAITCDGAVVRVNGQKIGAPFIIEAIGSPEGLKGAFEIPNNYVYQLIEDGVKVDISKSNNIVIPKYEGVISYEYIRNK